MSSLLFICNNISSLILNDKKAAKKVYNAVTQNKINWQKVIELASGWLVLPTLYDNFEKQKLWSYIPEDIFLYLKTVHELSEERAITTQKDIREVFFYFIENNIPAVAIKGAAYHINKLYSGTTQRIESDIDLLIPDNYLTLSYDLLKNNGFSAPKEYEEQWEKQPTGHHLPSLLNISGTEVEIHQFPYPHRVPTLLTSAEVWDEAITHDRLPDTPSPTHMIMLVLIHSMITNNCYCLHILDLRVIQDTILIRQQYEKEIDWMFIEKRFKAAHLNHIPSAYFQSIEYFFGMPAPVIYKKNWRTFIFIQRIRLNNWISGIFPHLYFSPIKRRYCHEKNNFSTFFREYRIRLQNKAHRIFSNKFK